MKKLSRQMTSSPRASNASHKCEPRNPAPPVTRFTRPGLPGATPDPPLSRSVISLSSVSITGCARAANVTGRQGACWKSRKSAKGSAGQAVPPRPSLPERISPLSSSSTGFGAGARPSARRFPRARRGHATPAPGDSDSPRLGFRQIQMAQNLRRERQIVDAVGRTVRHRIVKSRAAAIHNRKCGHTGDWRIGRISTVPDPPDQAT